MKLYVCWGTFKMGPHTHPCEAAHTALLEAGYNPEVVKTYGLGPLPKWMNPKRAKVRELKDGNQWVPALEGDDGELIAKDSQEIIEWAKANPAGKA